MKNTKIPIDKTPKVSIYEEIAKRKMGVPSPNTYSIILNKESKGYYYNKRNEKPSFTDDLVYKEQTSPTPLYLPKLDLVKPKVAASKIGKLKLDRLEKIK